MDIDSSAEVNALLSKILESERVGSFQLDTQIRLLIFRFERTDTG